VGEGDAGVGEVCLIGVQHARLHDCVNNTELQNDSAADTLCREVKSTKA
jgi:hypothetical protein